MRKRVINHVADTIFWYILYFLPVLAYLMFVVSAPFRDITKEEPAVSIGNSYEESLVCTIPVNTSLLLSSSFDSSTVTKMFFTVNLTATYYDSNGASQQFKYPVLAMTQSNYNFYHFPSEMPCLVLSNDYKTVKVPLTFEVPTSSWNNSFTLYIYNYDEQKSIGSMSNGVDYLEYNTVYVADSLYVPTYNYDFKDFVNSMGFEFATDNIIVNSLADIFGTGGIMPMFDNNTPFIIFAWFIGVYLLHLLVDFLLFIPRIAHKWMKDCTGGD